MSLALLGATTAQPAPAFMRFLPLIVLAAAYFVWFRPRMNKIKAERARVTTFEIGDRVQTVGGLVGTAVFEADGIITIRTSSGTELDFVRRAIAGRYVPPTAGPQTNEPQES